MKNFDGFNFHHITLVNIYVYSIHLEVTLNCRRSDAYKTCSNYDPENSPIITLDIKKGSVFSSKNVRSTIISYHGPFTFH